MLEVKLELTPENTMRVRLRRRNWKRGMRVSQVATWTDAERQGPHVGGFSMSSAHLDSLGMTFPLESDPLPLTPEFPGER